MPVIRLYSVFLDSSRFFFDTSGRDELDQVAFSVLTRVNLPRPFDVVFELSLNIIRTKE